MRTKRHHPPSRTQALPLAALAWAVIGAACLDRSALVLDVEDPGETRQLDGCFTTRYSGDASEILPVDLGTGTLGAALEAKFSPSLISSLGAIDGKLITCWEQGVEVVDLRTGELERIEQRCDSVTSDGTMIWINSVYDQKLFEYRGLQALRDGVVERPPGPSAFASRLGAGEGRILAAWHSTSELIAIDAATLEQTTIAIPDYDGWIAGLAEVGDERYVLIGQDDHGIRVYDRTTGEPTRTLLGSKFPGVLLGGLACAR